MNRPMEKIGLLALAIVVVAYIIVLIAASIAAFPIGLIGLLAIGGCALLFLQVVKDRRANKEDDYYSKNVEK
jgi:F0F1-type ATP synthase assembly protein I